MSTAVTNSPTLDISATPAVPFSRLVKVELRKMVDTRAGLWLLILVGVVTFLGLLIFGLAASDADKTFSSFSAFSGTPQGFILPVLGILLVTQEWGQRTAIVTFTLEPRRDRVIVAKLVAALAIGLAAIALAMLIAVGATLVFGPAGAFNDASALDFVKLAVVQVSGILEGFAFGLIFLGSAPAIVTYFVLPAVFSTVVHLWGAVRPHAAWIDLGSAHEPFINSGSPSGQDWAHVVTASLI
ncbi:MAG TPA: ABC transporter permease, partial [Marmoricola sp.]|nr:ABC transporter permease [Marmoricola sp.]